MYKPRFSFFSLLFDILIDAALIGAGIAFYYHFEVFPLGPFILNPIVLNLFGSEQTAVLVISLLLFLAGLIGLMRMVYRVVTWLKFSNKKEGDATK